MWKNPQHVTIRSGGAVVGALLTACINIPNSATGRITYQGVDPMGAYSGAFYPSYCTANFVSPKEEGQEQTTSFRVTASRSNDDMYFNATGIESLVIGAHFWDVLDRDKCQVYDVQQAPPDDHGRIHVVMHVDCRLPGNSHVWGTFDGHCDVLR